MNASSMVLGCLGLAVLAVVVEPLWRRARRLVTLVHEAGHTVTFWLTGHWVTSLKVTRDGEGVTKPEVKRIFWPADVAITLAGNTAPPIAGLVLARGIDRGWDAARMIAVLLVIVVLVVLIHADWHTLLVMTATGAVLALVFWRSSAATQVGAVVALSWFLLLGGLRQTMEGAGGRAARGSDEDVLAGLTAVPALVWQFVFLAAAVAAFIGGARMLLY
jgi:Peptidase M50B-like